MGWMLHTHHYDEISTSPSVSDAAFRYFIGFGYLIVNAGFSIARALLLVLYYNTPVF
jgi:hypothetical protein